MNVKMKDREDVVEQFRLALTMAELKTNYETADLVLELSNALRKSKGKLTIIDVTKIKAEHQKRWEEYHNPKVQAKFKFEEIKDPKIESEMLSRNDLAEMFNVNVATVQRWTDLKYIKAYTFLKNGNLWYKRTEIMEALKPKE